MELTGNNYTRGNWRKLLATRRGTLIVAGVCAAIAALILVIALNRYRDNLNTEGNQETVLVASGLIQKGTSGNAIASEQLFKPTSIAAKQASTGAIADTTQLRGEVASTNIYPGQQLTAADFTANGGLATKLSPDQRAMTVTFDSAHGMVGQLHEGDHVDVYGDVESGGGRSLAFVRLLAPDTEVLKAGSGGSGAAIGGSNPQNQQSNVTLKVSGKEAGILAFAADNGKVWLVLRPANAVSTTASTIGQATLLIGATGGAK